MAITIPSINKIAGGYEFEYIEGDESVLTIKATNIFQDGRKNITAEFEGRFIEEGCFFAGVKINILSIRDRKDLVSKIKADSPKNYTIDWDTIVEGICIQLIILYREGTPTEELWTNTDVEPPKYLIDPILPLRKPSILFGDGASGKTQMALLFSICVLLPWTNNPFGFKVEEHSTPVLYLDYETDEQEILWRMKCLQLGLDLPDVFIHYRRCFVPLTQDVENIKQAVEETGAGLIIVDNLGPACGGELKDAEAATTIFSAVREIDKTFLFIAHNSKSVDTKRKTVFGTVFFENLARSVWEVRSAKENEVDSLDLALYHHKANQSRLHAPMGFNITFNSHKTFVRRRNPEDISELREGMSLSSRILFELKGGGMVPSELADMLESGAATVNARCQDLKNAGKIMKMEGKWCLVDTYH